MYQSVVGWGLLPGWADPIGQGNEFSGDKGQVCAFSSQYSTWGICVLPGKAHLNWAPQHLSHHWGQEDCCANWFKPVRVHLWSYGWGQSHPPNVAEKFMVSVSMENGENGWWSGIQDMFIYFLLLISCCCITLFISFRALSIDYNSLNDCLIACLTPRM